MNFFLDLFIDSVIVGVPYFILLCIVNILRAPYLAGKELHNRLEIFEPSKIIIEEYHYHFPTPYHRAGILIKNKTDEELDMVIELTGFHDFDYDDFGEPHPLSFNTLDKDGCYFDLPKIGRKSHQVIYLAELQDDRIVFLTKKPFFMLFEFFFARPKPQPQPDFFRLYFILELEMRGKLKKEIFDANYACSIMLRVYKPNLSPKTSYVEIEEITYVPKENDK